MTAVLDEEPTTGNPFDAFDAPQPAKPAANPFDAFDAPKTATAVAAPSKNPFDAFDEQPFAAPTSSTLSLAPQRPIDTLPSVPDLGPQPVNGDQYLHDLFAKDETGPGHESFPSYFGEEAKKLWALNASPVGPPQPSPTAGMSSQDVKNLPTSLKAAIGATHAAQGVGDILRTPLTWETGLAAPVLGAFGKAGGYIWKAINAAFTGQMTAQAAQNAGTLVEELKKPKDQQDDDMILKLGGGLLTDSLFGGLGAAHLAGTKLPGVPNEADIQEQAQKYAVSDAIADARKNGPSPEFKAFFGGIDPEIAGTTPEKVAAFARNLGMEWRPSPKPDVEMPSGGIDLSEPLEKPTAPPAAPPIAPASEIMPKDNLDALNALQARLAEAEAAKTPAAPVAPAPAPTAAQPAPTKSDDERFKELQQQLSSLDMTAPDFDRQFEDLTTEMEQIKNRNAGYVPGTEPKGAPNEQIQTTGKQAGAPTGGDEPGIVDSLHRQEIFREQGVQPPGSGGTAQGGAQNPGVPAVGENVAGEVKPGQPADEYGAVYGPKLDAGAAERLRQLHGTTQELDAPPQVDMNMKVSGAHIMVTASRPTKPGSPSMDVGTATLTILPDGNTVLNGSTFGREIDTIAQNGLKNLLTGIQNETNIPQIPSPGSPPLPAVNPQAAPPANAPSAGQNLHRPSVEQTGASGVAGVQPGGSIAGGGVQPVQPQAAQPLPADAVAAKVGDNIKDVENSIGVKMSLGAFRPDGTGRVSYLLKNGQRVLVENGRIIKVEAQPLPAAVSDQLHEFSDAEDAVHQRVLSELHPTTEQDVSAVEKWTKANTKWPRDIVMFRGKEGTSSEGLEAAVTPIGKRGLPFQTTFFARDPRGNLTPIGDVPVYSLSEGIRNALQRNFEHPQSQQAAVQAVAGTSEIPERTPIPKPAEVSAGPQAPGAIAPPSQRLKLKGTPQTFRLIERLPQSPIEKESGEQPVRVKNERTGKEETMLESDFTPISEKAPAKPSAPQRDLDAELRALGMEPSVFSNKAQKAAAIERAKAKKAESVPVKTKTPISSEPGIIGMGGAIPSEFEVSPHTPTGIKNATVDKEREARGMPSAMQPAKRSFGAVWDQAMADIDRNPEAQDKLIDELRDKPRAVTDVEDAMILHRQIDLQNEFGKASRDLAQAYEDGRAEAMAAEKERLAGISDRLQDIYNIGKSVGTETARGLNARKMMAYEDFSLAQMTLSKRASKGGRPLTEDEQAQIQKLHDQITATQQAYDAYVEKTNRRIAELEANKAIDSIHRSTPRRGPSVDLGQKIADQSETIGAKLKAGKKDEVTSLVQKLARFFVEQGVATRDELIDKVHAVLTKFAPEMTRRDTMDAISGYGDFRQLSKDAISVQLRDLKGQMQQVAKLEDIQSRQPPLKTGVERRTPSDEERRLIKQVNDAKRRFGIKVTDPATQLQSALGARKTYYRNQIADLEAQIANRQRIVKETGQSPTDAELEALKAKRNEARAAFDKILEQDPQYQQEQQTKYLEKQKAALEKSIAELEQKIASGQTEAAGRPVNRPADPALEQLKQRRDDLNRQLAEARKKPDDQKYAEFLVKRLRTMQDAIAEMERRVAAGDISPQSKAQVNRPLTPELEQARQRLDDLNRKIQELRHPPQTPEQIALKTLKTRLANRTAELEAKLAAGDFTSKPRRELVMDAEATRLKAENQRAKDNFRKGLVLDRLANRSWPEKAQDTFVKWRRAFLLSSPTTLAKLTAAAAWRAVIVPAEEVIGGGLSRVFPSVAAKAAREGGFNSRAEAKSVTEGLTTGMKDAWQTLRTGKSDLDTLYGHDTHIPRAAIDFFGSIHGALKAPIKRAEFARSLEKQIASGIRAGVDVSDPLVQTRFMLKAYQDANRAIFLEKNSVVDAYKRALSRFSEKDKTTGRVPVVNQVIGTTARTVLPIVRVPANIVSQAFEYATGSVTGAAQMARAYREGTENLTPEEADDILRHLKRGLLGAALLLLGFYAANHFGGYFQKGKKRPTGDVKYGEAEVDGQHVPGYLLHVPLLEMLQIGATARRVADSKLRKKDTESQGITTGIMAGALGLTEEVPFIREMLELARAFDPYERDQFFGQMAKSIIVPQFVEWTARQMDKKESGEVTPRKPTNLKEDIEQAIPRLRQNVPVNHADDDPHQKFLDKLKETREGTNQVPVINARFHSGEITARTRDEDLTHYRTIKNAEPARASVLAFQKLPVAEAKKVFEGGTPAEKALWKDSMDAKLQAHEPK